MEQNKIKGNILVDNNTVKKESFLEQINNDNEYYKTVDSFLQKNKLNNTLCFYSEKILNHCQKKYLISYSEMLNSVNLLKIKQSITPGNIYFIGEDASITDFKLLIKEIKYKNIDIVYISELIKE